MNSLILAAGSAAAYLLAYRLYGRFIGGRIFGLSDREETPSVKFKDGVDFVPSRKHIVLGHHFTTIAGLGPIVGPAIGIIWGWVPALIWVVFGAVFMGAVHDFSAMVISARNDGKSIGELTGDLISPSTRYAFHFIIQFLLWIVVAIFAMIMGILFAMYPSAVLPILIQIPIAIWLGIQVRRGKNDLACSTVAVIIMFLFIWLGIFFPVRMLPVMGSPVIGWCLLFFIYVFFASTLPVDLLLQPRDYINSHQLLICMALLILGVITAHPPITAPAINPAAGLAGSDIPPLFPLLFITIACGAISGFHSLAASGTTVKQIAKESDMLTVAYGGMLLEGLLAVIVLIAIAGGLGMGMEHDGTIYTGRAAFDVHYASWASAKGLASKIEAFVIGGANLMAALGLPRELGRTMIAVFIVSFAGTTLDSATRIQRLSLQELCTNRHGKIVRPINNRYIATLVVVGLAAVLVFMKPGARGALILWPLFGALNQLLAALGLTVATVYLSRKGKSIMITFIPMLFMLVMTVWAMLINLKKFLAGNEFLLAAISMIIFSLSAWLLAGAASSMFKCKARK